LTLEDKGLASLVFDPSPAFGMTFFSFFEPFFFSFGVIKINNGALCFHLNSNLGRAHDGSNENEPKHPVLIQFYIFKLINKNFPTCSQLVRK